MISGRTRCDLWSVLIALVAAEFTYPELEFEGRAGGRSGDALLRPVRCTRPQQCSAIQTSVRAALLVGPGEGGRDREDHAALVVEDVILNDHVGIGVDVFQVQVEMADRVTHS